MVYRLASKRTPPDVVSSVIEAASRGVVSEREVKRVLDEARLKARQLKLDKDKERRRGLSKKQRTEREAAEERRKENQRLAEERRRQAGAAVLERLGVDNVRFLLNTVNNEDDWYIMRVLREAIANEEVCAQCGAGLPTGSDAPTLRAFLHWSMRQGALESNAAALYDGGGVGEQRKRTLPDAEIAIVWKACRNDQFGNIVKLLILTGARRDEVGHLHLSELDLENAEWLLPEDRSKNRREHFVPLNASAVDILTKAVETREAFVFGYGKERGFSGWSKAKKAFDKRIADAGNTIEHWTLHDLRRAFASGLQRLKIEPHIVEACLNHTPPKLEQNYQTYRYAAEKRAALARWATHVDAVLSGKTIDNVVSLLEATAS